MYQIKYKQCHTVQMTAFHKMFR